jgi:very-short-patch-repair endonuclease
MPSTRSTNRTIAELAASSCFVVHSRELRLAGVSRTAVARRIADGDMAMVLPRTYVVGPGCHRPSFETLCMAGVRAAGPGAVLDGAAAATLLGVWDRGDGTIDVTVPGRGIQRPVEPFRFIRVAPDWTPTDPRAHGPIPVTGFADMCACMARTHSKWQVAHVIWRGMYERLVTLDELRAHVETMRRAAGAPVLRDAIDLVLSGSAGTRTRSEDRLLVALQDAGVSEPVVNTKGAAGLSRDEPDFLWLDPLVNVEVDGDQHQDPAQASDDARRDADIVALGGVVIRVPWRAVWRSRDRRVAVDTIREALRGD